MPDQAPHIQIFGRTLTADQANVVFKALKDFHSSRLQDTYCSDRLAEVLDILHSTPAAKVELNQPEHKATEW